MDFSSVRKLELDKQYKLLVAQWMRARDQLLGATDDSLKPILEYKCLQFEHEIEALEAKIRENSVPYSLLDSHRNNNVRYSQMEQALREIDYKALRTTFEEVLARFRVHGGAVLLLIKDSYNLYGDLSIEILRDRLKRIDPSLPTRRITFPWITDRSEILRRLGGIFGVDPLPTDHESWASAIIETICRSASNGTVVFLEFKNCDQLQPQEQILNWFLTKFWQPLTIAWDNVRDSFSSVKCIIVMTWDRSYSLAHLPTNLCCLSLEQFETGRILELPLGMWTEEDIREWMAEHGRVGPDKRETLLADTIAIANGVPRTTYTYLLERLTSE
jgi:hypothetical protein